MIRENDSKEAQGFAAELRRLRHAGRLSLAQLSELTHYSRGYLSNVENGHKPATADLARRLDEVLRAEGALASLVTPAEDAPPCPYRGLAAFGPDDARWFFGRERSTAALISRVAEYVNRDLPLVVFGASGAGKSSLLCAGLVPSLASGALPAAGSADWPVLVMTPTAHPTAALAESAAKLLAIPVEDLHDGIRAGRWGATLRAALGHGGGRLVLVVDQFEELFTLCEEESERQAFVGALCGASRRGEGGERAAALVVLGVRADFYGRCLAYPELLGAVQDNQFAVGAMSREELIEAITGPARVAKLDLEPGLVELLLRDLGIEPGIDQEYATYEPRVLPLLSHALLATWQQRQGTRLTVAGYQLTGGIHGAVAATAERVYTNLDATARQEARRLLLRLVRVGKNSEDSRRRTERNRLVDHVASTVALEALVAARLLTLDRDCVEITHEALLRAWPRLRDWIDTDRAWLLIRQQLTEAAESWDREDRHPATLYRGPRLATAREWVREAGSGAGLTSLAHKFLETSIQLEHHEQQAARRRTRRLHQLVAGLTVLFVLAAAATMYAVQAREDVIEQRNLAISRKVASEATGLRASNPALAGQLSLAAYRLMPTVETRSSLLGSWAAPHATVVTSGADLTGALALSPDSRTLVTGTRSGMTQLWDVSDPWQPRALATMTGHSDLVVSAAFSPDGRLLATGSKDQTVRLWDVVNRHEPRALATITGHTDAVASVAFAPTGTVLATAGGDRTARLWEVSDPQQPTALGNTSEHSDALRAVAFSPQGRTLATVGRDRTVQLWDVGQLWDVADRSSPRPLSSLPGHTELAAGFSPDGHLLATAGQDRAVRLWDVADPRQASMVATLSGHDDAVSALAWSGDGHMLATAGDDRTIRLWDVTDPHQPGVLAVLTGHTDAITSLVFSRDGHTLASDSDDDTVRLWEVTGPVLADHAGAVFDAAFSPNGRVLATVSDDRTVRLRDVSDPRRPSLLATLTGHTDTVRSVAFSPDGHLLATASWDRTARLWDVTDPRRPSPLSTVTGHGDNVRWVAFSPNSQILATSSDDRTARLWDVSNPRGPTLMSTLSGHSDTVRMVAFSPDGHLLATASWDGTARLWNVTNPQKPSPLGTITGHKQMRSIVFRPNGNVVATTTWDGAIRLWDVADPQRPRALATLTGHNGMVFGAAFSPDGHTLASTGIDGTVQLWDVTDPERPNALAVLVTEHRAAVFAVAFSPDGHTLATTMRDRTTRLWETDAERAATRICGIAQNALSAAEWDRYFTGTPYNPPCS